MRSIKIALLLAASAVLLNGCAYLYPQREEPAATPDTDSDYGRTAVTRNSYVDIISEMRELGCDISGLQLSEKRRESDLRIGCK